MSKQSSQVFSAPFAGKSRHRKNQRCQLFFSEDTSVELISHMADNLNSLVLTHNLINHKEPVQQLDKVHPTRRSEFPIPLDDETGEVYWQ